VKRSKLVGTAHNALQSPDRMQALSIINVVNLTLLEREIIIRSELDGENLFDVSMSLKNWVKNPPCSLPNCNKLKRLGMVKIGTFLSKK
jgi:hypothetical protein